MSECGFNPLLSVDMKLRHVTFAACYQLTQFALKVGSASSRNSEIGDGGSV